MENYPEKSNYKDELQSDQDKRFLPESMPHPAGYETDYADPKSSDDVMDSDI